MVTELKGIEHNIIADHLWWQVGQRHDNSSPSDRGSTKTACYVGGSLAVVLTLVLAISPLRRAFFAGLRNLPRVRRDPFNQARTLGDLIKVLKADPTKGEAVILLESMQADHFFTTDPFRELKNLKPVKEIVVRGVQRVERSIFRTATNIKCRNLGYDYVEYAILHPDLQVSLVRAFQRATGPFQSLGFGSADLRPTFYEFGVSNQNWGLTYLLFEGERLIKKESYFAAEGLARMRGFVQESLQRKELVRLERPDELVPLTLIEPHGRGS